MGQREKRGVCSQRPTRLGMIAFICRERERDDFDNSLSLYSPQVKKHGHISARRKPEEKTEQSNIKTEQTGREDLFTFTVVGFCSGNINIINNNNYGFVNTLVVKMS